MEFPTRCFGTFGDYASNCRVCVPLPLCLAQCARWTEMTHFPLFHDYFVFLKQPHHVNHLNPNENVGDLVSEIAI